MRIPKGCVHASVWPAVPTGATYTSEILASARYAGTQLRDHLVNHFDIEQVQGNLFALGAGSFVDRTFGGDVDPESIVRHRTPFTFFASFLCTGDEEAWMASLVAGDAALAQRFMPPTRAGRLSVQSYRICPECVAHDRQNFGVGHWHVLHQIPALFRCPWHRVALHDRCEGCGASLGGPRLLRLPGDRCRKCNSEVTTRDSQHVCSPGYEAFEALVVRANDGRAPEVRPLIRIRIMDRIIFRRLGAQGVPDVMQKFLASWGVSSAKDLEPLLGCAVSERLLVGLFRGVDAGCSRYLQAAALAFALQHSTAEDIQACMMGEYGSDGPEELFAGCGAKFIAPTLVRELCRLAAEVGYPMEAARGLADGQSPRKLAALVAPKVTERFLDLLATDVRACYKEQISKRAAQAKRRQPFSREVARACISAVMLKGAKTRREIFIADPAAYRWLRKHDSVWLDQVMPRLNVWTHWTCKKAGLAAVREALIAAVHGGANTRALLRAKSDAAYRFALKHDAEWLDGVLPSRRKSRP